MEEITKTELFLRSKKTRNRIFKNFCIPCSLDLETRIAFFERQEESKEMSKHLIKQSLESELSFIDQVPEPADPMYKILDYPLEEIKQLIRDELYFVNMNL